MSEEDKKINLALETLLEFGKSNYSARLEISDDNTLFDGLAAGINMLGEHLEYSTSELEQSIEKNKAMLNANPDVIFRISKEGNYIDLHANPGTLILPKESFQNTNIKDTLSKIQAEECLHLIQKALKTRKAQVFEYDLIYQGKQYFFEGRIVNNGENEVLHIVRNVTNQKKTELLNAILLKIAVKSGIENITISEFCKYIQEQLELLIDVSGFYIIQQNELETITFIHLNDTTDNQKIPFTRKQGNGLSEYIIRTGKSLLLRGKQTLQFQKDNGLDIYGSVAKCWMAAPLMSSGKVIGVIACQSYVDEFLYSKTDLELLTSVGNQIGLWLEQQRAKNELKRSEEKYRNLFQKMNEGLLFSTPEGIIEMVNPAFIRLFEYSEKELIGINAYDLLLEQEYRLRLKQKVEKRKQGVSEQYEAKMVQKSGKIIWVFISASPQYDNKGNFIGVMSIIKDISERKEAEKIKKQFTQQLEKEVETQTLAIKIFQNELNYQVDALNHTALVSTTDINGNIIYANDIFCSVSGYSFDELNGKNHRILKSNKQPQKIFTEMWKMISKGKVWKGEIINKAKDGSYYWVDTTIVPFFNVNGEIEKYVSIRFDITKQKIAQENLNQSLAKEKELGKLKSYFVSTVSHQFRTPLAIIQSNSELLNMITENCELELKPKLDTATERIRKEIERMTELMDDILLLGKIASGKNSSINKRPTDILEFCKGISEQFNDIQKDGRKIDVEFSGEQRHINIDQNSMNHTLNNLISNAFKYSIKENPKIYISFEEKEVKIIVTDTGIGIPENEIKNLFQPFHRASNASDIPGSGLGLAIVKEYVELNGGKIQVQSQLNRGATFTITFPNR